MIIMGKNRSGNRGGSFSAQGCKRNDGGYKSEHNVKEGRGGLSRKDHFRGKEETNVRSRHKNA